MDIRRYFGGIPATKPASKALQKTDFHTSQKKRKSDDSDNKNKTNKKRKPVIRIESDSDEDPLPSPIRGPKIKSSGKKQVISSDDDDNEDRKKIKSFIPPPAQVRRKSLEKASPVKKPISVTDFFGKTPVKRESRVSNSKTPEAGEDKTLDEDTELHEDQSFLETLEQLDSLNQKIDNDDAEAMPGRKRKSERQSAAAKRDDWEEPKPKKPSVKEEKTPVKVEKEKTTKTEKEKTPSRKKTEEKPSSRKKKTANEEDSKPKSRGKIIEEEDTKFSKYLTPQKKINVEPVEEEHTPPKGEVHTTPTVMNSSGRISYRDFRNRSGPTAIGSRDVPEGSPDCLKGLTFVLTGVLESIERDDIADILKKCGAKITSSISKKTSYVVVGREAGPSKISKAVQLGTKTLNEDDLFSLIRRSSGEKNNHEEEDASKSSKKTPKSKNERVYASDTEAPKAKLKKTVKSSEKDEDTHSLAGKGSGGGVAKPVAVGDELWVEKYKPTTAKQIIGQQGEKSNAKKLLKWLQNWQGNQKPGKVKNKPFPGRWNASDDGSAFKAALLSGSPGIGKTTTATIVCKEAGYSYLELNASDTRSKKNLKDEVQTTLLNQSISAFGSGSNHSGVTYKHCLIMDEVDGMAGNEDRGGMQELIQLIKSTKIPIICICNDRSHQKMRSLSNHCFDLRFQKPRMEQIKAAMMSICYKENINVTPTVLQEIIIGANQDVRQVLHHLSMRRGMTKNVSVEDARREAQKAQKDTKLSPFDALKKVFSKEDHKNMSIHDKSDLFFYDYSLMPLFVQENYINVRPLAAQGDRKKHIALLSKTADSICDGDLVEKTLRSTGNWGLLPTEAICASVIPGELMEGFLSTQIAFPSWLGKNSSRGKLDRFLQELTIHMRLRISGQKTDINLDYRPRVLESIVRPLVKEEMDGVRKAVDVMESYDLLREDLENLTELSQWGGEGKDPMSRVATKVKAAFTRMYNSDGHLIPYSSAMTATKKGRGKAGGSQNDEGGLGEEDQIDGGGNVSDEDEAKTEKDGISSDSMIKVKSSKSTGKQSKVKTEIDMGSIKGKGRGKGRGRGRGK